MNENKLPTKPGPYYWREKDGDEWEIHTVFIDDELNNTLMALCPIDDTWYATENWGGQWLPIPTPDELVELQAKAKAKAYDEGTQQIAVYSEVIWSDNYLNMLEKADLTFGSPKVRVRVCKEVVV